MIINGVGIGCSMAAAQVIRMTPPLAEPQDTQRNADITNEQAWNEVQSALQAVSNDLNKRSARALEGDKTSQEAAPILAALAQMAQDPALLESIRNGVFQGKSAARATWEGFATFEAMLHNLGGYMAERAKDLHDVAQRVIAKLLGVPVPGIPESDQPFVLVAQDLSPADTAALDLNVVQAIVTIEGGPTSHTAILARSRGIVAVVGASRAQELTDGQMVVVDATRGTITTEPTEEEIKQVAICKTHADRARQLRGKPGQTSDGHHIALLANIAKPEDALVAHEYGAEGIGLFRTEFLFIGNTQPPSIEEQTQAYIKLLSQFEGKKVVIRLLDAGADKPLPFLTAEDEPNPALGLRGLRALRTHKNVLDGQLTALAAADKQTNADLWVMAPMVADEQEAAYFVKLGKSKGLQRVGVMAEVPSIALVAEEVAKVADFVSIGTNDLTQYTLAADRTLGSVSNYQTAWHPAVLRSIKMIADAGLAYNMPVGVCGEAAADPDLAVALTGLGVTSLSMTPVALDNVRAKLANISFKEACHVARCALAGEYYTSIMRND